MLKGNIWGHGTASFHTEIKCLTITIQNDTTKATMTQKSVYACIMIFNMSTKSYDRLLMQEENTFTILLAHAKSIEYETSMKQIMIWKQSQLWTDPVINLYTITTYNLVLEDKWHSQLKLNIVKEAETCKKRENEEPLSWFCKLLSSNTTGSEWERREKSSPPNSSMPGMFLGLGLFRRLSLYCSKCLVISASRKMSAVIPQIEGVLWSNIMGSC